MKEVKLNPKIHKLDVASKYKNVPKPYRDLARGMESQFAKMMIEKMKKTVQKVEPQSTPQRFYDSVLDDERVKLMTQGEGLGLQKVILDQIYFKNQKVPPAQVKNVYTLHTQGDKK